MIVQPYAIIGQPRRGGVLIVGDHASNAVPPDIDLGIDPALLDEHIALDIGVEAVARLLMEQGAVDAAFLARVSRLVVDLNRDPHVPGIVPETSDGHVIGGNIIDDDARVQRIARFHTPYHDALAALLAAERPAMILSLHSFTPQLQSRPDEARPWPIGILYNRDDRLARIALSALTAAGVDVGDQLPYSGRQLNYTMNRHAEAQGIPYLGVEMRQDVVADAVGRGRMVGWLKTALAACRNHLAQIDRSGK